MTSAFINYGQSEIHYLCHVNGPVTIICLHGYGESAQSFGVLSAHLPGAYSLIAIDLPFHGATSWNEPGPMSPEDLAAIIKIIFKKLSIIELRFIVIGYSMGGRIAMSLLQCCSGQVSKLVLLAPDGMKTNFWYWLATQTGAGNRLFKHTMAKPGWFKKMLTVFHRFGLINKTVFKFADAHIQDEAIRNQLYQRWTGLRKFQPDLNKIRSIILTQRIPVKMLYGKYDRITLAINSWKIISGTGRLCQLFMIESGHNILNKKHAPVITKLLTT